MSTEATNAKATWKGLFPSIIVMACALSIFAMVVFAAYPIGKAEEDKRQFIVSYRQPVLDEFWIAMVMDYVVNSTEYNDVLFHGDSTSRFGVDAKSFEMQTNLKAFNVGTTFWIGWAGYFVLLERYLESHPAPKVLVLSLCSLNLPDSTTPGIYKYRERFVWSYGFESEDTRPFHANPSIDYTREGIRTMFGQVFPAPRTYAGKHHFDNWMGARWLANEFSARRGSAILNGPLMEAPWPNPEKVHRLTPDTVEHLKQMAALAEKHGFLVVYRPMPELNGRGDLLDGAIEQLRLLETNTNNLVISRPEVLGYSSDDFFDNAHLNSNGAAKVTSLLAVEITELLRTRKTKLGDR